MLGLGVLALAAPAGAATTTRDKRIVPQKASEPGGDFVYLKDAPGEGVMVREDLAKAARGRERTRKSLAYFAQLSDFQLADEESPIRVEALDETSTTFAAAFRPQEALMPFLIDAAIQRVNEHKDLDFAILTGDNADNSQRNETEWVRTLLDGGRLNPNSGSAEAAASCMGVDPAEAARYTGVQDYDDYFAVDDFYDPDQPAGLFAQWPSYPGLMDRAQQPFDATGLRVSSYLVPGNHDALVQGNQAANAAFAATAVGCVKPMGSGRSGGVQPIMVPPDPARAPVTKAEYRELMSDHGLGLVDADELEASGGAASYYSFSPKKGVRLIGLDTVATGGLVGPSAEGNLDDPEFKWLGRKLDAAAKADELVIVYSHHGPTSLTADLPDELAGDCAVPTYGPGCDADPRNSEPIHLEDDVVDLLASEPHVIAWVAGHSHVNDVAFRKADGGKSGFWVIRTSAEADWPHQDRLIELMDNQDGTLSLIGTLIDNLAPAAAPAAGDASAFTELQLASLARTFGYNDPQAGLAAGGDAKDRNVELLVADPRRAAAPGAKLKVKVTPRTVKTGKRTTLKVRVTQAGAPVKGARVRLRSVKAKTNKRGRARLTVTLRKAGVIRARKGAAKGRAARLTWRARCPPSRSRTPSPTAFPSTRSPCRAPAR